MAGVAGFEPTTYNGVKGRCLEPLGNTPVNLWLVESIVYIGMLIYIVIYFKPVTLKSEQPLTINFFYRTGIMASVSIDLYPMW